MVPDPARVTLEAVARVSGVSTAAVSRALNGRPGVSDEIRERVRAVASTLGYRPNRAARSLASGRSSVIGLVLPASTIDEDAYSGLLVRAVAEAAAANDQALMLWAATGRPGGPAREILHDGLVDGLVVSGVALGAPWVQELLDAPRPAVLIGRHPTRPDAVAVGVDNTGGGAALVDHLVGLGRRRPAVIAGPEAHADAQDRLDAYRAALARHGLALPATHLARGDFSVASGYAAMRQLLVARPDAVIAANDNMAVGALRALREAGLSVPGDVAVVGFDDVPLARQSDPPVTSVHQDLGAIGRLAVATLLDLLDGRTRPPHPLVVPTTLVVRASTVPA